MQYPLFICCHSFSPANHLVLENYSSLIYLCITSSLESTSRFIPSASLFLSCFTSSSTSQLISVIIPSIVIAHSFTLFSRLKTYLFKKILPTVDLCYLLYCLTITGPDRTCCHAHYFIFTGHSLIRAKSEVFLLLYLFICLFFLFGQRFLDNPRAESRRSLHAGVAWVGTGREVSPFGVGGRRRPKKGANEIFVTRLAGTHYNTY